MPLSPGDKLGPYESSRPSAPAALAVDQNDRCYCRLDAREKGGVAAGPKANSEIHIMHTTGATPFHTLALVQQLLGNGFKSWIVGHPYIAVSGVVRSYSYLASTLTKVA